MRRKKLNAASSSNAAKAILAGAANVRKAAAAERSERKSRMEIGRIPSLTWNHLQANSAVLEAAPVLRTEIETNYESLPAGVQHITMNPAAAKAWLEEHAPTEEPEAVVAGKAPIYHPQTFGTGLGQEYDDLLKKADTAYELLEVAPNTKVEETISWSIDFADGNEASQGQLIHVQENSSLTVLISARSEKDAKGTAAISTKIVLEKGAQLFLIKAQVLGNGYVFLDDTGAALAEKASLHMIQVELGGGKVYVGTQPELIGDRSSYEAQVGYLGKDSRLIDVNYNVIQRGRRTNAQMTFDGVLDDQSVKAFRGTIDFRKGSKASKGDEQENVLLLSDNIVNKTLPIILCEEEDVEGRHGASIGQLDEDMLFYMATRGIDRKEAEQIMVRARLGAVVRGIPDLALRAELMNKIEEAFAE